MSKYFIPVEIGGKWWVREYIGNYPISDDYGNLDQWADACHLFQQRHKSATKYPTLESDSAYWKSKAGVKMTSDEFEVKEGYPAWMKFRNGEHNTVVFLRNPDDTPYLQEMVLDWAEQTGSGQNYGFTYGHDDQPTTYALPKQDNEDAWDEVTKAFEAETPNYKNLRLDVYIQHLYVYIRSNYSISKIK